MKMSNIRQQLGVGHSFFAAMKQRMGLQHVQLGFMSQFAEFLRENPTFKQSEVYHRPDCTCANCKVKRAQTGRRRGRPSKELIAA